MSEAAVPGFAQFHAFERDLLFAVHALDRAGDPPHGLAIKEYLETEYGENVNHSRFYQNLDQLVERGLLTKGQKDDRTNEYATTDAGRQLVEQRAERRAEQVGYKVGDAAVPGDENHATASDGGEQA